MLYPRFSFPDQTNLSGKLDRLLTTLNIPHTNDFDSMIITSQVWLRRPDQERWQLKDLNIDQKTHDKVLLQLKELGMTEEIKPNHKEYDYVLLLGATIPTMQNRLEYLIKLWQQGTCFKKIIFLVGLRPLSPKVDKVEQLVMRTAGDKASKDSHPQTELEGAEMIYSSTKMPDAMRQIPVEYVDSPRRWENYRWQRANTRATAETWIKTNPKPGETLVISELPNAHYQLEVIRQELTDAFEVDLAAQAALPETRLVLFLDALALWLNNTRLYPRPFIVPSRPQSEINISPPGH